jgi:hypothetical protein
MVPLSMVVRHELVEDVQQAPFPEENQAVQTLLANRAHEPLRVCVGVRRLLLRARGEADGRSKHIDFDTAIERNVREKVARGREIFRFDTFGDEAFWGDALQLHRAIAGERLGGVGPGVSPRTALDVGLKVTVEALPRNLVERLKRGRIDLDDPATTVALLRLNAVVGLTGFLRHGGPAAIARPAMRPVPFHR